MGLNAMSARIEGLIAASPEALNTFKDRLLEARYVEHEYYDTILFAPVSSECYQVPDTFPRLVGEMIPVGIVSASYAISIDAIAEFRGGSLT